MTNKNLSKQICKECGIEPLYKVKHFNGVTEVWSPVFNKEELRYAKAQKQILEQKEIYPDFENNNNFIKLEEIMLTELAKHYLTVVKWVYYWSDNTLMHEYILITKTGHKIRFKHNDIQVNNWFVERENRAACLILFILWKVIPICGEQIKQAINQADWEV